MMTERGNVSGVAPGNVDDKDFKSGQSAKPQSGASSVGDANESRIKPSAKPPSEYAPDFTDRMDIGVNCPICADSFNETAPKTPLILPSGQTYCRDCIKGMKTDPANQDHQIIYDSKPDKIRVLINGDPIAKDVYMNRSTLELSARLKKMHPILLSAKAKGDDLERKLNRRNESLGPDIKSVQESLSLRAENKILKDEVQRLGDQNVALHHEHQTLIQSFSQLRKEKKTLQQEILKRTANLNTIRKEISRLNMVATSFDASDDLDDSPLDDKVNYVSHRSPHLRSEADPRSFSRLASTKSQSASPMQLISQRPSTPRAASVSGNGIIMMGGHNSNSSAALHSNFSQSAAAHSPVKPSVPKAGTISHQQRRAIRNASVGISSLNASAAAQGVSRATPVAQRRASAGSLYGQSYFENNASIAGVTADANRLPIDNKAARKV